MLKSGTDFRNLSVVEFYGYEGPGDGRTYYHEAIFSFEVTKAIEPDPQVRDLVREVTEGLQKKLSKTVGYSLTPLDATGEGVRTRESNLGNFAADIMRFYYQTDLGECFKHFVSH